MESKQTPMMVLDRMKVTMLKKGSGFISGLARFFKIPESFDKFRRVEINLFFDGMKSFGIEFSKEEINNLLTLMDIDQDGKINFDELMIAIRGKPNVRRQAIIDKAFLKFDKDCNGFVTTKDLEAAYNAKAHPKVKAGQKKEEEATKEFLQNFGEKGPDGKVTRTEWNDYYSAISATIDNDEHFIILMKNAWKLE